MKVRPRKVGERRDAARYVLEIVVRDRSGREHENMSANSARLLLEHLNGIDPEAAQHLLDQANEDYDMANEFGKLGYYPSKQEEQKEAVGEGGDDMDDTVIED